MKMLSKIAVKLINIYMSIYNRHTIKHRYNNSFLFDPTWQAITSANESIFYILVSAVNQRWGMIKNYC